MYSQTPIKTNYYYLFSSEYKFVCDTIVLEMSEQVTYETLFDPETSNDDFTDEEHGNSEGEEIPVVTYSESESDDDTEISQLLPRGGLREEWSSSSEVYTIFIYTHIY